MNLGPRKSDLAGKSLVFFLALLIFSILAFAQNQTTSASDPSGCMATAASSDASEVCGLLNQGMRAVQTGNSDVAIEAFRQAKSLDPTSIKARLFLANAYASRYLPGAASKENVRQAQQAIDEYKEVLGKDPDNLTAIDSIADTLFNMAGGQTSDATKLAESKSYHQRHILIRDEDSEPYYWIGLIDWEIAYRANKDLRASFSQGSPEKPLGENDALPPAVASEFAAGNGDTIEEGISNLTMAIDRRPEDDDAMAYLNLLYRQKADTETTPEARAADLRTADELIDKATAIKKRTAKSSAAPPTKNFDSE